MPRSIPFFFTVRLSNVNSPYIDFHFPQEGQLYQTLKLLERKNCRYTVSCRQFVLGSLQQIKLIFPLTRSCKNVCKLTRSNKNIDLYYYHIFHQFNFWWFTFSCGFLSLSFDLIHKTFILVSVPIFPQVCQTSLLWHIYFHCKFNWVWHPCPIIQPYRIFDWVGLSIEQVTQLYQPTAPVSTSLSFTSQITLELWSNGVFIILAN